MEGRLKVLSEKRKGGREGEAGMMRVVGNRWQANETPSHFVRR